MEIEDQNWLFFQNAEYEKNIRIRIQKLVQNGEMELKINFDKFKSKCVLYMFYIFNVFILFLILNFELELFLIWIIIFSTIFLAYFHYWVTVMQEKQPRVLDM